MNSNHTKLTALIVRLLPRRAEGIRVLRTASTRLSIHNRHRDDSNAVLRNRASHIKRAICTALGPETTGLITAHRLALMKPTAFLINIARGQVIDEDAVFAALRDKKIGGAGLDTFDIEPLPLDHPFRKMDNVVLTPHLGYVSERNYRVLYSGVVEDIRAWLDGKPVRVIEAK